MVDFPEEGLRVIGIDQAAAWTKITMQTQTRFDPQMRADAILFTAGCHVLILGMLLVLRFVEYQMQAWQSTWAP